MSNIGVAVQKSVGIHTWSVASTQKSSSTKCDAADVYA